LKQAEEALRANEQALQHAEQKAVQERAALEKRLESVSASAEMYLKEYTAQLEIVRPLFTPRLDNYCCYRFER